MKPKVLLWHDVEDDITEESDDALPAWTLKPALRRGAERQM